ncbi:SDR family NAD(P)-dependent oxidoreductase [Rhodovulum marinum]|uniref:NADP-dependent 3-hydroxy acid dehydrogenase YdfG n=1 Tax=Rhodovulum marinum TaxID=320662 RepID=A0A4R2PUJ7_9RHOB|nr:SDR family NAD(P)-dependent oxidoreductase [Rhodovulum marinum]TCP39723.1 NADP-dependent 3-hydroxy acid dehydrogenase YdfG [Rhodovulum marinum]
MTNWIGKRYWIVGASEGLGRAVAERLSALGVELVLSARNTDRLEELAAELPARAHVVGIDVSDSASVKAAATEAGEIDGLVYLAGVYWPQAAQDWDADQVEAMCDINFTGAARVLGQVVPRFVERGTGHVVLTGSLSGFRGLPGAIGYCASKAGVMSLAESMQADLRGTGVKVQVVNPGFIRTRLTEKNDFAMPFIMDPEPAAHEFVEHMMTDNFARSFPTVFSWLFRLSQFLPDWLYFPIFAPRR